MSGLKGLDTNIELTKHAIALRTQGYEFVVRYYSHTASKNLSLGEARALSEAGLKIGAVWETGGTRSSFFNRHQGLADGSAAYLMAQLMIGQPLGSAIYFAVDYDATEADLAGPITEYFEGVQAAFTAAANGGIPYKIGVYGSGRVCRALINTGVANYSWLSQSMGFADSRELAEQMDYNIIQKLPTNVAVDDGIVINVDPDYTNPTRPTGLFQV